MPTKFWIWGVQKLVEEAKLLDGMSMYDCMLKNVTFSKVWVSAGKPIGGYLYHSMKQSKRQYKFAVR